MAAPIGTRNGPAPQPGDILVVIHDFNARSADELNLRKSERVELIELDDGFGDGWYLGRHLSRGGTGLFPGVYTTKAPSTVRSPQLPSASRGSFTASTPTHSAVTTPTQEDDHPLPPPPQYAEYDTQPSQQSARTSEPPRPSPPLSHVPYVSRSIGETLSATEPAIEDSTVMNETLSVIDEHITDLSTPRQSLAPPKTIREDSESEYSRDLDRQSYVAGPETDEEENERLTEARVRKWDHKKTADHLRSIGVDLGHCKIFEEQEISGDVLLDMDQGFIYMKEYDFGVMGRRLKTWHKVRDFQNEVRGVVAGKASRQSTYSSIAENSSLDDVSRSSSRMASGPTILPRIPSLMEKPGLNLRQPQQHAAIYEESDTPAPLQPGYNRQSLGGGTPPSPWRSSIAGESSIRPSAAMVRELTHSRRHSSVDHGKKPDLELTSSVSTRSPPAHVRQNSADRGWSISATSTANATPQLPEGQVNQKQDPLDLATSPQQLTPGSPDLDRGYFSGNEVDNRKHRNILRKRDSLPGAAHSRQSSSTASAFKRHSRLPSVDSLRPGPKSPAAKAYHSGSSYKGRFRSASVRGSTSPSLVGGATPPTVTNLEETTSPRATSGASSSTFASMQNKAKKMIGIRAASENLSQPDKTVVGRPDNSLDGSGRASPLASPTGSTTPSQTSHSLDIEGSDARKPGETGFAALPRTATRSKPKAKQETSAYTRGLLKITPEEARKTCDYSGWMKKKSSSLMTTWKPRLFILRGRRLSYYYSENDTEERGIIDISGHKVLVANSDAIITLHAQITGATSPAVDPTSPEPSPSTPSSSSYVSTIPFYYKKGGADAGPSLPIGAPFYFKLVPPKSGLSRAVQFTKPAVHYFQCDTISEGRKWMGELMKATIEHDWTTLETTNKQKTISLAKARARGERPKALLGDGEDKEEEDEASENKENVEGGLNITGVDYVPTEETSVDEKEGKTDSGVGETKAETGETKAE